MTMSNHERRIAPRVACGASVVVGYARNQFQARLKDLSLSGARLLFAVVPAQDDPMVLEWVLDPRARAELHVRGRVVWQRPRPTGGAEIGVRFEAPTELQRGTLERMMSTLAG